MRLKLGFAPLAGAGRGALRTVYVSSARADVGRMRLVMSHLQAGHVEPAAFLPALQTEFCELDALEPGQQVVGPRRSGVEVAHEVLPLRLEAVVVDDVV